MQSRFQEICGSAVKEAQLRSQAESLKILAQSGCVFSTTSSQSTPSPQENKEKSFKLSGSLESEVLSEAERAAKLQQVNLAFHDLNCTYEDVAQKKCACLTETVDCADADQCLEQVYTIFFELDDNGSLKKDSLKLIETGR